MLIVMLVALKITAWVVATCLALYGAAAWLGKRHWEQETLALVERLDAARLPPSQASVDFALLSGLPPPVQRHLRSALRDGQALVGTAQLSHEGTFNLGEEGERWAPFTSRQWIATRRPGFVWDGRVMLAPGLPFLVHDAYIAGEGLLHPTGLGLVNLPGHQGTPQIAHDELMRYVAEAVMVPTALLPGDSLRWLPVDDSHAVALISDGPISVSLLFAFGADGLVASVEADSRGRTVGDRTVPTRWQGRWWNYERRDGMLVPTEGEVAWLLPEGRKPYWRARLRRIRFSFEPTAPTRVAAAAQSSAA